MDNRRFLIAIGSPECPKMGLRRLPKVETDIERMTSFFTSGAQGYERVLATEIPLGANAERVKDELERWFSKDDRREDECVVIYYAGHGEQAGKFGQHHLFTSDSEAKRLARTSIETGELPKILFSGAGERPQSLFLILDTCYAAEGGGQAAAALAAVKGSALDGIGAGLYILASAGPNDTAGDGAFVDTFLAAVADHTVFGPGGAAHLDPIEISAVVSERFRGMGLGQQAEADVVGGGKIRQTFIRNDAYAPLLAGSTLEDLHHWDVKSRGVDTFTIAGDYFVGREAALAVLRKWLTAAESDGRARVVTGKPGSGKSAVLGRLVMELHSRSGEGAAASVSIHAHRLSLEQIAASVCGQLGVKASDLDSALRFLAGPGPPMPFFVDALDEGLDPRTIEDRLLIPLAAAPRVRLVVGTRKGSSRRIPLGSSAIEIDLDSADYFRESDVEDYVLRRLTGSESGSIGESEQSKLQPLAHAVAQRSGQSFLYARTVSRWLAIAKLDVDTSKPGWIDRIGLPSDVLDAFGRDLERFDAATKQRFIDLLLPLAYAQGKGLPQKRLWEQLATAIAGRSYTNADIRELKERAGYYITRDVEDDETVYRLFHEAFARYLCDLSENEDVHRVIYDSLRSSVPRDSASRAQWAQVYEPYVVKYLAVHAMQAGRLPELLNDAEFLLHASPQALTPVLRTMPPDQTGAATAYLRAYAHMRAPEVRERVQHLALAAAQYNCSPLLEGLRDREGSCDWFPIKAWYRETGSHLLTNIAEFQSACLVKAPDNIAKLAVVTGDGVAVLSLTTGEQLAGFALKSKDVSSAIEIPDADEILIALAYSNGDIRLVNVTQRREIWRQPVADPGSNLHICAVHSGRDYVLIAGTLDGTVSAWSLAEPKQLHAMRAHKSAITFVGTATLQGRNLFITCSDAWVQGSVRETEQVRLWDAVSFKPVCTFVGPKGDMAKWAAVLRLGGKPYLVSYFYPKTGYRVYDVHTSKELAAIDDVNVNPFGCSTESDSGAVFSGFTDAFSWLRISEGSRGSVVMEATATVNVEGGQWLGPVPTGGRPILVSIGNNVRVWDLGNLMQRSREATQSQVGIVREDGEPLFSLSAPQHSPYFAGLSRYGNLRVWSGEGRCILLKQVITSLESSTANDYDFLKLIDFGGKCLFVTAGRSGVVQAWSLDGNPIYRQLQVDAFVSAFNVCTTGQRLLAIMAARDGGKYRVGAWDVAQGEEITSAGRFMIESVEDKSIDYVAGIEYGQTTLLVGAMAHSFYRRITVWDLNSPPVHATLRAHGYPPREKIWSTNAARKITCMMTMRCDGLPVIVVGDEGGWITLWDAADGEVVLAYEAHRKAVAGLDSMQVAGKDVVISAGLEGTIAGTTVSRHDGKESSASETFTIEVGDRIRAIAALAGGRIVAGTEQGFLLFQIR